MVGKWADRAGAGRGGQGDGHVREALAQSGLSSELAEYDYSVVLILVPLFLNFTTFRAGVPSF